MISHSETRRLLLDAEKLVAAPQRPEKPQGAPPPRQGEERLKTAKRARAREARVFLREHADFLVSEIAAWNVKTADLVDAARDRFPFSPDNVWWANQICKKFPRDKQGTVLPSCRFAERIREQRAALSTAIREQIPLSNRFLRIKRLSEMFEWCSGFRDGAQSPRDLALAVKILDQIRCECGDDLFDLPAPQPIQHHAFTIEMENPDEE